MNICHCWQIACCKSRNSFLPWRYVLCKKYRIIWVRIIDQFRVDINRWCGDSWLKSKSLSFLVSFSSEIMVSISLASKHGMTFFGSLKSMWETEQIFDSRFLVNILTSVLNESSEKAISGGFSLLSSGVADANDSIGLNAKLLVKFCASFFSVLWNLILREFHRWRVRNRRSFYW